MRTGGAAGSGICGSALALTSGLTPGGEKCEIAAFFLLMHIYGLAEMTDAMHRDLDDIGATDIAVQPLNKLPYGRIDTSKAKFGDGVIFLTYSSLISSSDKVRVQQRSYTMNGQHDHQIKLILSSLNLLHRHILKSSSLSGVHTSGPARGVVRPRL